MRTKSFIWASAIFVAFAACDASVSSTTPVGTGGSSAGGGKAGNSGSGGSGAPGSGGSFGLGGQPGGTAGAGGASSGVGGVAGPVEGPGTCADQVANAQPTPVDLLLLLDTSGSMNEPVSDTGGFLGTTKWDTVRTALSSFVMDSKSAGLGVGVQYFPSVSGGFFVDLTAACKPDSYKTPAVAIAPLPGNAVAVGNAIRARQPNGNTPTNYALNGVLGYLHTYQAAHLDHRVVLVLVTDGLPNSCTMTSSGSMEADPAEVAAIVKQLNSSAAEMPPINTYVVGIFAPAEKASAGPVLDQMATAGGTDKPFLLNVSADLTTSLVDALNAIRGQTLPCEFTIPPPKTGAIDFSKINVEYKGTSGNQDVLYVGDASRCDAQAGGWYYDSDPAKGTPKKVIMCGATCQKFKADAMGTVELHFGCKTKVIQ